MGRAHRPGGLYRNGSGAFVDAKGNEVPLAEVPTELLTDEELAALAPVEAPTAGQVAGSIEPTTTETGTGLSGDFPGRAELVAAGLDTAEKVWAHPDLAGVAGIGPKRLKEIEALRPKAPEA